MSELTRPHNVLVVSDLHVSEGSAAETGDSHFGNDAFLYDGAFSRFLRYHEQLRRGKVPTLPRRGRESQNQRDDNLPLRLWRALWGPPQAAANLSADAGQDAHLVRPWRLVIAGDFIDFWDVTIAPDDLENLKKALDQQRAELAAQGKDTGWLVQFLENAAGPYQYDEIRRELERLELWHAPARALESTVWGIELLRQKPAGKPSDRERMHGLGTTWQEVVWKLTQVYRGHQEIFAALAWFIACGNQVVLLKGNHDVELHWPQVHGQQFAHLLLDAYRDLRAGAAVGPGFDDYPPELWQDVHGNDLPTTEAFKTKVKEHLRFEDWLYYEKDFLYIEHGNQYEPLDSSVYFLYPMLPSDTSKIELPWGGSMARYVYNKILAVHPFAVNIKPEDRIIPWMIRNDLFRLLGILLAELPDILRALSRAVRQGFRNSWLWGDHSMLGLIPILVYDWIQLLTPGMWEAEQKIRREHQQKLIEMANRCLQQTEAPDHCQKVAEHNQPQKPKIEPARPKEKLYTGLLLHLGAFGFALWLALAGIAGLTGREQAAWLVPILGLAGVLALIGLVWDIALDEKGGWKARGQILLQLGYVSLIAGLVANLFLTENLRLRPVLIPLLLIILGHRLTGVWPWEIVQGPLSQTFTGGWVAQLFRSSSSLLGELGLACTLAGLYYILEQGTGDKPTEWLLAAVSLFLCGWVAGRLRSLYLNRQWLNRLIEGWLEKLEDFARSGATWAIGLLALGVLLGPMASIILHASKNLSEDQLAKIEPVINSAAKVSEFLLRSKPADPPRLVYLLVTAGIVILAYLAVAWFLKKLQQALIHDTKDGEKTVKATGTCCQEGQRRLIQNQLAAIEDLAHAEQRTWARSLVSVFAYFLLALPVILLVLMVLGWGAAVQDFLANPAELAAPLFLLLTGSLAGAIFWILRQINASGKSHDPKSSFGDLFYRMAVSIADILHEPLAGLGRPRYFIFGHDHWADSQPIKDYGSDSADRPQRWYANAGAWLRGYAEEQREQETGENHSTFIQIIPGLDEESAPRVLRWNDGANQPERVVQREESRSAGKLFWDRLHQWRWRIVVWTGLLIVSALLALNQMDDLKPINWAAGIWFGMGLLILLWEQLQNWRKYLNER